MAESRTHIRIYDKFNEVVLYRLKAVIQTILEKDNKMLLLPLKYRNREHVKEYIIE